MFEQTSIAVRDEVHFRQVQSTLEHIFASGNISGYLERLRSAKIRVRDFEGALQRGLLGRDVTQAYEGLDYSDRGQIRELYLLLVERVAPELRSKFLKLFAYY